MKRICTWICVLTVLLSSFSGAVFAAENQDAGESSLTGEEIAFLQRELSGYGYGEENFTADVLYDGQGNPAYMLGVTDGGYLIHERGTYGFEERGEGNPFSDYMDVQKYYGGPICYFVYSPDPENPENCYYDISRNAYSDFVPKLNSKSELLGQQEYDYPAGENDTDVSTTANSSGFLPKCYDYIRTRAFGFNNDDTCSAVATCIAINYIALQHNMAIISKDHISEILDQGMPDSDNPVMKLYPNAYNFHRYMVDTCGMGAASFDSLITEAIFIYTLSAIPMDYNYNFVMSSTPFPRASTIKSNIDDGKPVLITTTIGTDGYNWHTMCVYGYQDTADGTQLLVHAGWYSEDELTERSSDGNELFQKLTWIDEDNATFGYYFSFNNPLSIYTDIPSFTSWSYPGILYVVNHDLMNGVTDTTFLPNRTMSRAMLVSTLYRIAGSPSVTYQNIFSDVPSNMWYANSVIWAAENNIVNGVGNDRFNPNGNITREQFAVIMFRFAEYCGYDTSKRADLSTYPDSENVSGYAKTALSWAVAENLVNGIPGNDGVILAPKNSATRAQAASILMRFCEEIAN